MYSLKDVLYAGLDTEGKLYMDKKQDELEHLTDISDKLPGKMGQ
ncbi:hypothetical protein [Thermodesulfitimonas sp.]